MEMQQIRTSLFHAFMGTLLDFFVYLIRGLQNVMAAPVYEQLRAATQYKEPEAVWLGKTVNQQQPQQQQQAPPQPASNMSAGQLNKNGKMLLNSLPSDPLAIIHLVDAYILDDISNKLNTRPIAKMKHEETLSKQMDAGVGANNLYDLYSEPTFCYFFVDVKSQKCAKDGKKYQSTTTGSSSSQCRQLTDAKKQLSSNRAARLAKTTGLELEHSDCSSSSDSSGDSDCDDDTVDDYSATKLPKSSSFEKNILAQRIMCRQRSISECSDDSFICFADEDENNDDEENEYTMSYQTDSSSDDDDDSDDDGNDGDDDDDDDSENYEFVIIKNQEKNPDCTNSNNNKQVRFNLNPEVHVMHTWNFAYRSARKGEWQVYARDNARFQQRIQRTGDILNSVLCNEHRQKVFEERFNFSK